MLIWMMVSRKRYDIMIIVKLHIHRDVLKLVGKEHHKHNLHARSFSSARKSSVKRVDNTAFGCTFDDSMNRLASFNVFSR